MKSFDYRSKKWRRLSAEIQKRAKHRCESCKRTKLELSAEGQCLVAHHRLNAARFPEFAHESMLLVSVCEECHAWIHGRVFVPKNAAPEQLDWVESLDPILARDSDMQLFDEQDSKRSKTNRAREAWVYRNEYRRLDNDDRTRALQEANEIAERERQKYRDVGLLEDSYSESGTINANDEQDGHRDRVTKTPNSGRGRPS